MELWLIIDGEKTGPIQDYDLRGRIARGEVARDTPAWHMGLDAWRPLGEIAVFAGEFDRERGEPPELHTAEERPRGGSPPPLPQPQVFGRRFWARWLDIHLYLAAWWLGMWLAGRPIGAALNSVFIMVVQLVPWFIIEAVLLHRFATTPGKWLLGLEVVNADGSRLSLAAATLRSFRILVGGIGFGWSFLALFCQGFSLFTARRLGRPLWDHAGNHVVRAGEFVPWRIAGVVVGMFLAIQVQMAVISPHVMKSAGEMFPALKEALDKNPPWHLPVRE